MTREVRHPDFVAFGLTDAALSMLSDSHLIVTSDGRLAAHLRRRGVSLLTMTDLRMNMDF